MFELPEAIGDRGLNADAGILIEGAIVRCIIFFECMEKPHHVFIQRGKKKRNAVGCENSQGLVRLIGQNEKVARFAGIPVAKVQVAVFMATGLAASSCPVETLIT